MLGDVLRPRELFTAILAVVIVRCHRCAPPNLRPGSPSEPHCSLHSQLISLRLRAGALMKKKARRGFEIGFMISLVETAEVQPIRARENVSARPQSVSRPKRREASASPSRLRQPYRSRTPRPPRVDRASRVRRAAAAHASRRRKFRAAPHARAML